jgi:hypothetical protein
LEIVLFGIFVVTVHLADIYFSSFNIYELLVPVRVREDFWEKGTPKARRSKREKSGFKKRKEKKELAASASARLAVL